MKTQTLKIDQEIFLNDIELDKENQIEMNYTDKDSIKKFIKIANVDGNILILTENPKDIILEEWKGNLQYKKRIMEIEDQWN